MWKLKLVNETKPSSQFKEGLVEFIQFNNSVLKDQDYDKEIFEYLRKYYQLTNFKVVHSENGVIPMSLGPCEQTYKKHPT